LPYQVGDPAGTVYSHHLAPEFFSQRISYLAPMVSRDIYRIPLVVVRPPGLVRLIAHDSVRCAVPAGPAPIDLG
jgi:hypothetical protein